MSARRLIVLAAALSGLALVTAPRAVAQELAQPQVENSRNTFEGEINANAVFVRSGPSENFYPTLKLDKGTRVTVVGIKYNWLKIQPPKGSFSYVSQAFVERHGDGSVGRVMNTINVRAGSDLNAMKTTVQTKLEAGTQVKILGKQDEYYKIVPPDGAYLYVDQRFVDPVRIIAKAGKPPIDDVGGADGSTGPEQPEGADQGADTQPLADADPTTNGTEPQGIDEDPATGPTTAGAAAAADVQKRFEALEDRFQEASAKPIEEQSLDELLADYEKLAKSPDLTNWLTRAIDARLQAVKVRKEARDGFAAVQKKQQELRQQRQALVSEQEELQERIKANDVKIFTAVGVLRTSSLQLGPETLFRLTDPQTGRTVVYIRSSDPQLSPLLNQFIGVRGSMGADPQLNLRVIDQLQLAEAVDPTKVNGTVAATVVPPSLLPRVPTADTTREQGGATEPQ